jgi:hypothetical protein
VATVSIEVSFVMQRKVLVATVAAAPLIAMGFAASAETTVSTARTTPIATSTATGSAADDVKITADGSIKLTAAGALRHHRQQQQGHQPRHHRDHGRQ